jgi:histidinol-phosphate/aromatic aminotransferase/cobyric acid decarboxylase-like protein
VANLPKNTFLLVDEAYLHYATSPEIASAMPYVKQGKNVIGLVPCFETNG